MKKIIRTLGLSLVVAALLTSCSKDEPTPTTIDPVETVDPTTGNTVYTLTYKILENTSWKYTSVTVPVGVNWDADAVWNTDLLKEKANNCKWDDTIAFGAQGIGVITINDLGVSCNSTAKYSYSISPTIAKINISDGNLATGGEYGSYSEVKMYKTQAGKTYLSMKSLDPTGKQIMTVLWEKI